MLSVLCLGIMSGRSDAWPEKGERNGAGRATAFVCKRRTVTDGGKSIRLALFRLVLSSVQNAPLHADNKTGSRKEASDVGKVFIDEYCGGKEHNRADRADERGETTKENESTDGTITFQKPPASSGFCLLDLGAG